MKTVPYHSICIPVRFCAERNRFETVDIIVDIENDRVELVSEGKESKIRFDLIGANELSTALQGVSGCKWFQDALGEKLEEHRRRYHTVDRTGL